MAGWRVDDDREPQNGITHAHTKHVYDTYRIYIYTQPQAHTHALHMCAVGRARLGTISMGSCVLRSHSRLRAIQWVPYRFGVRVRISRR